MAAREDETEWVTEKFCDERSGNIVERVDDLKVTVQQRFEHIDKKLDRLLNGGNTNSPSYKLWIAVIAGINILIAGLVEIIKAITK